MCRLLGLQSDSVFYDNLVEMIAERVGGGPRRVNSIIQLGLLSEDVVERLGTPLDTLSHHLAKKLAFEPKERDLLLLRHEVTLHYVLLRDILFVNNNYFYPHYLLK